MSNAGAHLMGATTYAGWATYWPGASGPFAEPMNEIPKVVFSDSLAWLEEDRADGYLLALGGTRFEPTSTTVFSGGAVAHVFAAHP